MAWFLRLLNCQCPLLSHVSQFHSLHHMYELATINIIKYIQNKVNLFEDHNRSILLKTLRESNSLINWNISSDLPSGSLAITVELLSTPALFSLSSVGELERVEGGVPQEKNTQINKEKNSQREAFVQHEQLNFKGFLSHYMHLTAKPQL